MLAGDPDRRTLDVSDPAQDAVGYSCLGNDTTRTHGMPVSDQPVLTSQNSQSSIAPRVCVPSCISPTAGMALTYTNTQADDQGWHPLVARRVQTCRLWRRQIR